MFARLVSVCLALSFFPALAPGSDGEARLVLTGLDPVLLVKGQSERGKTEIHYEHEGFRYLFVSEENRQLFKQNLDQYAVQLEGACPVSPELSGNPEIFLVHEGRIYLFFAEHCRQTFQEEPEKYVRSSTTH